MSLPIKNSHTEQIPVGNISFYGNYNVSFSLNIGEIVLKHILGEQLE